MSKNKNHPHKERAMTVADLVFDYHFELPIYRLALVFIHISGSGDGGNEKIISDSKFMKFLCCSSSTFTDVVNYLLESGFIRKTNYGMQFGELSSGYEITVPSHLRGGV